MTNENYSFTFDALDFVIPYIDQRVYLPAPLPLYLGFGSVLVYALLIFVIFPKMAPKSDAGKAQLARFSKTHYSALFLYSGVCCATTLHYLIESGQLSSFQDYMCQPVPPYLRLLSITFTLSKVWEWVDTGIDICRGRTPVQIGFLHCYHHATTFLLFLLVMNFPGTEKAGMLLNGFVHTAMYYHYAFRLPKSLRPLITALQIVQLVTVTYFWNEAPTFCPEYISFKENHTIEFFVPWALVPVYCLLFIRFFVQSYILKTPKKATMKDSAAGNTVDKKVK